MLNLTASRGYDTCRNIWLPKKKDTVIVAFEKSNVYDPYACGIYLLTQGTISGKCFEKSNVYDPYACGIYLLTHSRYNFWKVF